VDEVKIIKSSDSKAIPNRNSQPDIVPLPSDVVWILNLGPTARFLREPYINTATSNGSSLLAFGFYY
jgi:hypothetical protein